ncbi:5-(carboxyamino)imidazole ribonucleotide synthase [Sphingomonas sp. Leaf62]|uniref:5-(carboxyamino)imidazole ribonucleotide synthase n=1 Tax=Sphingomonas sp. Leaf62 TaxID=1736228 RepID=UPI0006F5C8C9|nr:5-(carboxyamino)imidazole ribonucleotide synthase [Sphingomonas sp. Leaf62]KQN71689.1 phosphoribosylaminoimidazole carboxylase [Sphingomonas sp. Leaf62]
MTPLPPGSTIGIIGSGQLGRMIGVAAAQLGYRIHVYAPDSGPANDIAFAHSRGDYDDIDALRAFARQVDVVTYEFENIAAAPIETLGDKVRPSARSLAVAQDRVREKRFVEALGGRPARWAEVADRAALDAAIDTVGCPAVLKTTRFGYDGKGQARLLSADDASAAWLAIGGGPAILEAFVDFEQEFSVVLARGVDGTVALYPSPVNVHKDGILDTSTVPAPSIEPWRAEAEALACKVADALDHVGVLTLEFFCGADGAVFNEMAPRVHNSGHWTIEGAETSQFENHVRAVLGLPLGGTGLTGTRVEMTNLIGDDVDHWQALLTEPGAHLHLYGKNEARPGRKMGHVTRVKR